MSLCLNEECKAEFEPLRKWQKFCSPKCQKNNWQRKAERKRDIEGIKRMVRKIEAEVGSWE